MEHSSKRIFLTGATGSMGLAITGALVTIGYDVVGVTRSREGARSLLDLDATPVEVDLFDREAVREAVDGSAWSCTTRTVLHRLPGPPHRNHLTLAAVLRQMTQIKRRRSRKA